MYPQGQNRYGSGQGGIPLTAPVSLPELLSRLARRALIHEAAISPKPGLVTALDRGAHRDMDFGSFVASAMALGNFFREAASIGMEFRRASPMDCLSPLRCAGIQAESSMEEATGGVNTHRGAIFSMGLAVASAARTIALGEVPSGEKVAETAGKFVSGIVERELSPLLRYRRGSLSAGERLFVDMGVDGVRGEAERGFPSALVALSRLRSADDPLSSCSMCGALLAVIALGNDTNVFSRGGADKMASLADLAKEALIMGGMATDDGRQVVVAMERYCLDNWLSPGGSADMLAMAVFLLFVEREWDVSLI